MKLTGRFTRLAACRGGLLLAALALAAPTALAQTTTNLVVAKDATIRGGTYATTKHGSKSYLATRRSDDKTYERRAVLTFDTETTVPARATIQSAKLVLTVRGGNNETRQLSAQSIPVSFDQADVTWKQRKSGTNWTYSGGDVAGTAVKGTVNATVGSQVTFDVTALVQKVVNGDYGSRYARFLVRDPGSSSRDSYKEFHSREASTSSLRPRLIVVHGGSSSSTAPVVSPNSAGDLTLTPGSVGVRQGKWAIQSNSGASTGKVIRHPNAGLGKISTALASPTHYFEVSFKAKAGTAYRMWLRGRADGDDWANDSVHVQFSGSVNSSGSAVYRIGSTSSAVINLEECDDCGISGWEWQDNGYGKGVLGPKIYFATTGTHKIRVQTREDGLAIDKIVLSPSTYLSSSPGGGTSAPAPAPAPEPAPSDSTDSGSSGSGTTLKVLMWNIHHGVGTDGRYDINRLATWMAKMNPDVITLNEVEKYTGWGNENQPARFEALLESKTGRSWHKHFIQEFGDWSSNGKGHLILSKYPLESTARGTITASSGLKGAGAIGEARITVNGRTVTIVVTHLDPDSQSMRLTQARDSIRWAASFAENRILTGDMNAWPDQSSIAEFNKTYKDSWTVAASNGTATAVSGVSPFGATKKGRIDYIFFSRSAPNLVVKKSQVVDTRDSNGVMPSDHRPVMTTFEVR